MGIFCSFFSGEEVTYFLLNGNAVTMVSVT